MTCACGMDSVGTCLVCGARLCPEHALRGSEYGYLNNQVRALGLGVDWQYLFGTSFISLDGVRSDLRPLFRFSAQREAFATALNRSGVICGDCRVNGACKVAGATQPTAPTLEAGGSQQLRDAVAAYLLDDMLAWDSMESDAAVKDALFQDLIHLAREKAERLQVPVEWEAESNYDPYLRGSRWTPGKVRTTEEAFYVVDTLRYMTTLTQDSGPSQIYDDVLWYMNIYGQWGTPYSKSELEMAKTGLFKRVFRVSWLDKPPRPKLGNILKRAAELLAPA